MTSTVISYVPALHKGYLDFFSRHPGDIYILDTNFVREFPRMERDIRALKPLEVRAMLRGLGIVSKVEVLTADILPSISKSKHIVMPDEDINRQFAATHLKNADVEYVNTFLRWDLQISTTEHIVPPDRTVSRKQAHAELMAKAAEAAVKSPDWWRQIGAVITRDAQPILAGYNRPLKDGDYIFGTFGDPRSNFDAGQHLDLYRTIHAEASLIAQAAKEGQSLEGTSIFVTTFPCPVCAKLLAAAGIKKVYYSKGYSRLDAEDILKAFGIEIILVEDQPTRAKTGSSSLSPDPDTN